MNTELGAQNISINGITVGGIFVESVVVFFKFYYHIFLRSDIKPDIAIISEACDLDTGAVTMLNYLYDIISTIASFTMCTSTILLNDKNDLIFASNLDFWFHQSIQQLLYRANYYKDNQLLYTSTDIFSLVKSPLRIYSYIGNYVLALNQRMVGGGASFMWDLLYTRPLGPVQYMRRIGEKAKSFEQAMSMIENGYLLSPAYFIIGGMNDEGQGIGCVLERGRAGVDQEYCLGEDRWYLVHTNWDRHKVDPKIDFRRVPLERKLNAIGYKKVDEKKLYELHKEWPTFVAEAEKGTVGTVLVTMKKRGGVVDDIDVDMFFEKFDNKGIMIDHHD